MVSRALGCIKNKGLGQSRPLVRKDLKTQSRVLSSGRIYPPTCRRKSRNGHDGNARRHFEKTRTASDRSPIEGDPGSPSRSEVDKRVGLPGFLYLQVVQPECNTGLLYGIHNRHYYNLKFRVESKLQNSLYFDNSGGLYYVIARRLDTGFVFSVYR